MRKYPVRGSFTAFHFHDRSTKSQRQLRKCGVRPGAGGWDDSAEKGSFFFFSSTLEIGLLSEGSGRNTSVQRMFNLGLHRQFHVEDI